MSKILLTGITCCLGLLSWSQQAPVSSGGEASGSGGTVSYSIGQVSYTNETGSNGSTSQGVQQTYSFKLGLNEDNFTQVSIYPNPTNDYIILELEDISDATTYAMYDSNGKLVTTGEVNSTQTEIDMRQTAAGQYSLSLLTNSGKKQSIKIIKN